MNKAKTCPHCGYEKNRPSALMCGLCGGVFPEAQEKIAAGLAEEKATAESGELPTLPFRRDFARENASNRYKSLLLLLCFPPLIILLGWAIGEYVGFSRMGIIIAAALSLGYIAVAYFAGDRMILGFSGASRADPKTHLRLINVVDEMRIAAGLPMPEVFVIDSNAANAFATGRNPEHAKVAVTQGLIKLLNRDELQGVIAHEMSHVRNLDIRYMLLVAALVGAVVLMTDGMWRALWWGGRGRKGGLGRVGGRAGLPLLVIVLLLAILAPLFAKLLQMAISRKREFLADSSAVELTRNPLGLASALEKLDKHLSAEPLAKSNRATQHLFIVNPLRSFSMKSGAMFSTHPPIQSRIRLLKSMT